MSVKFPHLSTWSTENLVETLRVMETAMANPPAEADADCLSAFAEGIDNLKNELAQPERQPFGGK